MHGADANRPADDDVAGGDDFQAEAGVGQGGRAVDVRADDVPRDDGPIRAEQYALPEAVGSLRAVRRVEPRGELTAVSGADPLNFAGIITPGDTVAALATNRILFRDGIPVAIKEGEARGERLLVDATPEEAQALRTALVRRRPAPLVRAYLGKTPAGR